jgi:AraC-like DNA-binding protein
LDLLKSEKKLNENIEYICDLLSNLFDISVRFLNSSNDIIFSATGTELDNPLNKNIHNTIIDLFKSNEHYTLPIFKSTKFFENFLAVNLYTNNIYYGKFIIGPSICSRMDAETVNVVVFKENISLVDKAKLCSYFNTLPIINFSKLIYIGQLIYLILYDQKLDFVSLSSLNTYQNNIKTNFANNYENVSSNIKQNGKIHHPYVYEQNFLQYIREGNLEKARETFEKDIYDKAGVLSKKSSLRSEKNLNICHTTLVTRAAIEGGLDPEQAFTMSDMVIQCIEEIDNTKELQDYRNTVTMEFVKMVNQVNKCKYPSPVRVCENYIKSHIYEHISVKHLSKLTALNPNYLSSMFKATTGFSVLDFINKERIHEARKLLITTDRSLTDISTLLNFFDQSHFTKAFKKYTGVTPKIFRDENKHI